MHKKITPAILLEFLSYNQETGVFIWNERDLSHFNSLNSCKAWNGKWSKKVAGNTGRLGYITISIYGRTCLAHRMAWIMVNKADIPTGMSIDHINQNASDNRISNLRLVTHQENMKNRRLDPRSSSGHHGVYFCNTRKMWASQMKIEGVHRHLGYFDSIQGAVAARKEAEKSNGYHQNHGNITAR